MKPNEEYPLCDKCGAKPATNHICYGGTGKTSDLCDDCVQTEDPFSAAFSSQIKNARCQYCSGPVVSGGIDSLGQILGEPPRMQWMCESCFSEHHSYTLKAFGNVPQNLPYDQQIEHLKKIQTATDAHMQAFVSERGN
jgi:hypothetical protein